MNWNIIEKINSKQFKFDFSDKDNNINIVTITILYDI